MGLEQRAVSQCFGCCGHRRDGSDLCVPVGVAFGAVVFRLDPAACAQSESQDRPPARLTADTLEVLDTALLPVLNDMVLDRYGDYVVVFNANTDAVPVFTALGQWVGLAETPDTISALIEIHERVNGSDA